MPTIRDPFGVPRVQAKRPPKRALYNPTNPGWGNANTVAPPVFDTGPPIVDRWKGAADIAAGNAPSDRAGTSIGVNTRDPNYRGIIDRHLADRMARLNAGLADMNIRRLGNARGTINRLGVRDPNAMLGQVGQYGLTLEDLQAAAANPWSELKAIDRTAEVNRGQGLQQMAGRSGFRSGGSTFVVNEAENARARAEALASQEALQALAQEQFSMRDWERSQRDEAEAWAAEQEAAWAQSYQPQTARWDESQGGYRWGNVVYDQYGNEIRRL